MKMNKKPSSKSGFSGKSLDELLAEDNGTSFDIELTDFEEVKT